MNHQLNLKRALLAIAVAVLLGAAAPMTHAQCISGLGATPGQLASQTWPAATPEDFTSFVNASQTSTAFAPLTGIATDGQGDVYVIDTERQIWRINQSGSGLTGANQDFEDTVNTPPVAGMYYALGELWVAKTDGSILLAKHVPTSITAQKISLGSVATGATSDGKYVWFSTNGGTMAAVQLPAGIGNYDLPTVVSTVQLASSNSALGTPVFDGRYIWTYAGSTLYSMDTTTNDQIANYLMSSPIANISFDGTYLWVGSQSSGNLTQFDPQAQAVKTTVAGPMAGHIFFDGASLRIVWQGQAEYAKLRVCDGATLIQPTVLLGRPTQEVFDGSHLWMIYGNGTLSVR